VNWAPIALASGVFLGSFAISRGVAWAQDASASDAETTASARALFEQGMTAVDARDFETAADRLARSLELRDSPVARTNYALALIELGRLVEASEHLRRVQRAAPAESRVHQIASERLASIEPRLGRLLVVVTGDTADVQVRVDDAPMPPALVGVEHPVDPGAHRVSLQRGDVELVSSSVSVESGQTENVSLAARPPTAEERAAQSWVSDEGLLPGAQDTPSGGVEQEWWFWTLIAAVVIGAGVGITIAVVTYEPQPAEPTLLGDDGTTHLTLVQRW
jgi:hypothetical protein